ncbi:hypothetical protein CFO_g5102 [Ceratocystis platani]|uniref:Uncharacterized protein n=1 Tax=Ceratocystis fimbriata f. sp. platani TaxID=88771 RepID=A0A0F8AX21_CERFI|nr:hypothetical protein CFO_g5102 [Ceratocystis platani]
MPEQDKKSAVVPKFSSFKSKSSGATGVMTGAENTTMTEIKATAESAIVLSIVTETESLVETRPMVETGIKIVIEARTDTETTVLTAAEIKARDATTTHIGT